MRKATITVPKDKCPMDVIADLGDRTANSWIFLHTSAIDKLKNSKDVICTINPEELTTEFYWEATDKFPETRVVIDTSYRADYKPILLISASDIAFNYMSKDPADIYFIRMK